MDAVKPVDSETETRLLLEVEDLDSRGELSAQFCYVCHCTTWIDKDEAG